MTIDKITKDYPSLPNNLILLTEVGSTAHGTGIPGGEDTDETAVVIESPEQVFTIGEELKNYMQRTQPEGTRSGPGDTDRQVYSLRSFLKLASSGNPSIQLVFWAPTLRITPLGKELRSLAPSIISREMIPRYRGYMQGQVMRMEGLKGNGHGKRGGGKREELIKEFSWDVKYGMHAARLGYQCLELLDTGKLELPIPGEAGEFLRAVRCGEVPIEEWREKVQFLDEAMAKRLDDTYIPEHPNWSAVEEFSIYAHQEYWEDLYE